MAYRATDQKRACAECVATLAINARESQAWRDGGSKLDATVTVGFVHPDGRKTLPSG